MGKRPTQFSPVRRWRIWRVQMTFPNGSVRYFGRFASEQDAAGWISAHAWLTKPAAQRKPATGKTKSSGGRTGLVGLLSRSTAPTMRLLRQSSNFRNGSAFRAKSAAIRPPCREQSARRTGPKQLLTWINAPPPGRIFDDKARS